MRQDAEVIARSVSWWPQSAIAVSLISSAITWIDHGDPRKWVWGSVSLGLAAVTVWAVRGDLAHRTIAATSLALVLTSWFPLPGIWPLFQVAILALPTAAAALDEDGRRTLAQWWSRGQLRWLPVAALAGVAAASLWLWWSLLHPDLSAQVELVPAWPWPWLVLAALVFSTINALLEELLFRGLLQGALCVLTRPWGAIVLQGALFGLVHWHGFPQGPLGALMAGTWAVGLGWMRHVCGGLITPWVAHIVADAVIFGIVVSLQ